MRRRLLLRGSLMSLLAAAASSRAEDRWMLVTPEEVKMSREAPPVSEMRGLPVPGAPEIVVEQPDAAKPLLHAPLTIRVHFVPGVGAAIDPNSFKASYGSLGLDITNRLLQHAKLSGGVLSMENVDIPSGVHTVTLTIADNAGRKGTRTFRFTVG